MKDYFVLLPVEIMARMMDDANRSGDGRSNMTPELSSSSSPFLTAAGGVVESTAVVEVSVVGVIISVDVSLSLLSLSSDDEENRIVEGATCTSCRVSH